MQNQKILKGAVIGYGFISSKGHMPAYLERSLNIGDVQIVAICDICPEREIDVPRGIRFYTDYKKLLDEELDLDFIDVCTHAAGHFEIAKLGLEKGLHVLCEKPLTTSVDHAEELIQLSIAKKKILFPCHNYKYAPVVKAIRDAVDGHKIGKIKSITLNTFRNTHAIGTKEWKPHWRRFKELSGGGIAMDHGSHSLYLMFEWLKGYPKSVTANAQNFSSSVYNTEDNFSAVYEFENGLANLHLSWTAGVRKVIYTLQGEKGAITVDDDQMQLSLLNNEENELTSHKAHWTIEHSTISSDWMDSSHVSWFNSMFDKFKLAIEQNDFRNSEIIDAYFCIQSITKAYESIDNNSLKLPLKNVYSHI